ncbi:MAG: hypothetical protein K6C36_00735 [Clostridia bacterium]|nr:hypothetical protein [Clostridia bacterium]
MLYKKNAAPELSDELFRNPTAEYRGTPFWAWNSLLTADELKRQIDVFRQMGLGGFHMHVRTGLENEYLSDEYMDLVRTCVEKAKEEGMLAWLYDEDRWPSGAAGGIVTKDERFRARYLLFTNVFDAAAYTPNASGAVGGRSGKGTLLACYDVTLDADGYLLGYRRIDADEEAKGQKWFALLEVSQPSSWYNNQTYADTLNPDAIRRFVSVTHERYRQVVGSEFDKVVPAIFTDEPQFTRKQRLGKSIPDGKAEVCIPWTDAVPEKYRAVYGEDPLDSLPELFWEKRDGVSVARYRYHDFITELFASSFSDVIGAWCEKNNISLTGHMMEEPSLHSQTAAIGEAMRSYRGFGLPGIDLLCNSHEFTTAKQCQSAARQLGREGQLSELYGVTGWDCDFRTYKHQGDWQAALGISVRVPHLSWYAMKGAAKRDYPASISYQSPWWKEYSAVEDHFARVNTAVTRGVPVCRIGVVHPVESYWLHWGPLDKTNGVCEDLDSRFRSLTDDLLTNGIDFDFISEGLTQSVGAGVTEADDSGRPCLTVGRMSYPVVIVPACETLRSATLDLLERFRDAGGRLIFLGAAPTLVDAVPSCRAKALYDRSEQVAFSRNSILSALKNEREVELRYPDGRLAGEFICRLNQDGGSRWLFIARSRMPGNKHLTDRKHVSIRLRGEFSPVWYDTESGDIIPVGADYSDGFTTVKRVFYGHDSLLLKLVPGRADAPAEYGEAPDGEWLPAGQPEGCELSEKNVLLLDMAEYSLDGGAFEPREEILRLDNICREKLGFEKRGGHCVQPWALEKEVPAHSITLRFTFESSLNVSGAELCLEDADKAQIVFNGEKVSNDVIGNYVDISIGRVALPDVKKGVNTLLITLPFGRTTNTEAVYLIGDFGVSVTGDRAVMTDKPANVRFGDLTAQGFPFYGGAVTYRFRAEARNGRLVLRATDYNGACVKVRVDGEVRGRIIYQPYILAVDGLSDGEHEVELELFIHRYNTFGSLHLVNEFETWYGPNVWETTGENWSYEYVLRKTGIMKEPEICRPVN